MPQGGVKALGGAKLKLVRARLAATPPRRPRTRRSAWWRRRPTWSRRRGSYLSSFTLAVTEVTERANLPMLTLSYSDLITSRGFKYVFQTSATAGSQAEQSLPVIAQARRGRTGAKPEDGRHHHRQHGGLGRLGQADEGAPAEGARHRSWWWTRPSRRRWPTPRRWCRRCARRGPTCCSSCRPSISDAKLVLEKMNEFGLGQGRVPVISFGIAIAEPDMLQHHVAASCCRA